MECSSRKCPFRLRLANDDGDIRRHTGGLGLLRQLDGARAIEKGPLVAQIIRLCDADLRAHAACPRFRAAIADRVAVLDQALAIDRAGDVQHAFHQRRLAGKVGADEDGAAWRSSAVGGSVGEGVRHEGGLPVLALPARFQA